MTLVALCWFLGPVARRWELWRAERACNKVWASQMAMHWLKSMYARHGTDEQLLWAIETIHGSTEYGQKLEALYDPLIERRDVARARMERA